jgi:hypothetical protein
MFTKRGFFSSAALHAMKKAVKSKVASPPPFDKILIANRGEIAVSFMFLLFCWCVVKNESGRGKQEIP